MWTKGRRRRPFASSPSLALVDEQSGLVQGVAELRLAAARVGGRVRRVAEQLPGCLLVRWAALIFGTPIWTLGTTAFLLRRPAGLRTTAATA